MSDEIDIVNPKKKRSTVSSQPNNTVYKIVIAVIVALIVAGISFYSGISYQKAHSKTTTAAVTTGTGGYGGAGGAGGGGRFSGSHSIGTVSAISATSITVTPTSGATAVTYTINSSTAITDSGQTVSYSDIQTGDTVLVTASSSTSTVATRILVNPSFGGFGGGAGGGGGSSSSGTDTTPETQLN
jgi:hypothetical protein